MPKWHICGVFMLFLISFPNRWIRKWHDFFLGLLYFLISLAYLFGDGLSLGNLFVAYIFRALGLFFSNVKNNDKWKYCTTE